MVSDEKPNWNIDNYFSVKYNLAGFTLYSISHIFSFAIIKTIYFVRYVVSIWVTSVKFFFLKKKTQLILKVVLLFKTTQVGTSQFQEEYHEKVP